MEEFNAKMKELNAKIKDGTDTVIIAGMEAKDVLSAKMKDAQSGLEAAKRAMQNCIRKRKKQNFK